MDKKDKILLILTGGTICSFENGNGEKKTDAKKAESLIESIFKKSDSQFRNVSFEAVTPLDILSENMTPEYWNALLDSIKAYHIESYRGVIILHGTDTLAYTANMLSLVLSGTEVPVFLVSSQLPILESETNGNDNFRVSVELIMKNIKPNVYVPYKNMNGEMHVHKASHLEQCPDFSNDFFSRDSWLIEDIKNPFIEGKECQSKEKLIDKIGAFTSSVIKLTPYVGLDYSRINTDGIKAIVHGTYHSMTMCVEKDAFSGKATKFSLLSIDDFVPVFVVPCKYWEGISCYETTALAVNSGIIPVWGMTGEMVYVKAMVGAASGYSGQELVDFMLNKHINHEFHF